MRVLISILIFLSGCGLIAYSYIGAFALIAGDLDRTTSPFAAASVMMATLERIAAGDIPQMTGFLYGGVLLIAVSIVHLIVKPKRHD